MGKIFEMFKSGDGKVSNMRVCSIFIVFSIMSVFIYLNIMAGIKGTGLVNLTWELITLMTSVLGVKAFQQKNENGTKDDSDTTIQATEQAPVAKDK